MGINLHQKMLEVMKAIEYLNKDDAVKYGQTSYRAMSEEKVTLEMVCPCPSKVPWNMQL